MRNILLFFVVSTVFLVFSCSTLSELLADVNDAPQNSTFEQISTQNPNPPSILAPNDMLASGESLYSPNKNYKLTMQSDGNLCISKKDGGNIWCINSAYRGDLVKGSYLYMQPDGNFCARNAEGSNVWCLNSFFGETLKPGSSLHLQNDGNLCLYDRDGNGVWCSGTIPTDDIVVPKVTKADRLLPNDMLASGESILSSNENYKLTMQTDGNLCISKKGGGNTWCLNNLPGVNIVPGSSLHMQADGNLCVYGNGKGVWCSGNPVPGSFLVMQDDGNLCIYDGDGNGVWCSGVTVN